MRYFNLSLFIFAFSIQRITNQHSLTNGANMSIFKYIIFDGLM